MSTEVHRKKFFKRYSDGGRKFETQKPFDLQERKTVKGTIPLL